MSLSYGQLCSLPFVFFHLPAHQSLYSILSISSALFSSSTYSSHLYRLCRPPPTFQLYSTLYVLPPSTLHSLMPSFLFLHCTLPFYHLTSTLHPHHPPSSLYSPHHPPPSSSPFFLFPSILQRPHHPLQSGSEGRNQILEGPKEKF